MEERTCLEISLKRGGKTHNVRLYGLLSNFCDEVLLVFLISKKKQNDEKRETEKRGRPRKRGEEQGEGQGREKGEGQGEGRGAGRRERGREKGVGYLQS